MNERRTYVAGGHVFCQQERADIDVEQCFDCSRLRRVNDTASPPYLLCDVTDLPEAGAEDPLFLEWWFQHHRRARPGECQPEARVLRSRT